MIKFLTSLTTSILVALIFFFTSSHLLLALITSLIILIIILNSDFTHTNISNAIDTFVYTFISLPIIYLILKIGIHINSYVLFAISAIIAFALLQIATKAIKAKDSI